MVFAAIRLGHEYIPEKSFTAKDVMKDDTQKIITLNIWRFKKFSRTGNNLQYKLNNDSSKLIHCYQNKYYNNGFLSFS